MTGAILRNDGHFAETTIDDECVLMSLETGDFFSLTGTARSIWERVDGQSGIEAITAGLAAEYDVPAATVADDVRAFLADLVAAGLIVQR